MICRETAVVFAEWAIAPPPAKAPRPPRPPASRHDVQERALWQEEFARWYLWHSSLRPDTAPVRSARAALREAEAKAAPHIASAQIMLGTLRETGHLRTTDIPRNFDPLAESKLDTFRRRMEFILHRKQARRKRLAKLDEREGGFFRSLRSVALMRFVQAVHKPPLLRCGVDKAGVFPVQWKLDGLDLPYVEANKQYRSVLRVDIDETFESLEDLKERVLAAGVPLPNIVSWFTHPDLSVRSTAEEIPRPHLIWLLDRPVWWKQGNRHSLLWRSVLGRLNDALLSVGADPNGMLNPMRMKNPLGERCGWVVLDEVPWSLSELFHALPGDGTALPITEPSLLAEDDEAEGRSQDIFRRVAGYANARARELKNEADGRERLDREVLAMQEDLLRLRHGALTPRQIAACERAAAKMCDFAWTLAHRGRPALPPEARTERDPAKSAAAKAKGQSLGGDIRIAKFREQLAERLPDAIDACWLNERVPLNSYRLSRYISASVEAILNNWDMVLEICQRKCLPVDDRTTYAFERRRHRFAARRGLTRERIEGIEKGWLPPPEPAPHTPKPKASPDAITPPRQRAFAPRRRRKKPLRVSGLAIGRPLTGDALLNDLQACVDEIVARAGGMAATIGHSTSDQLLRELNIKVRTLMKEWVPTHPTPTQQLTWMVLNRRWLDKAARPKSLALAIRCFKRVPRRLLRRAIMTEGKTPGGKSTPKKGG